MTENQQVRRSDWQWVGLAVAAHLVLFLISDWEALTDIHDAVYYRAHLADPLLQGDVSWWDNVTYRALRVGFVGLALPFRWLGVVPALLTVNLIALAAGTVAIRRISGGDLVASTLWVLNPGALVSTVLLLPDTLAWTAILWSLFALRRRRLLAASILAVVAVLTKEASLAALGMAGLVAAWADRDRRLLVPVVSAGVVYMAWRGFLTITYGPGFHEAFVGWPLVGWVEVFNLWSGRWASAVVGLFIFAGGVLVLTVWWRQRSDVYLAAAAGQAGLMMLLEDVVIRPLSNSTRIGGLFWPILAARRPGTSDGEARSRLPHPEVAEGG